MSVLGQKQTFGPRNAMSALPPKADMVQRDRHVRLVPQEDVDPAYSITSSVADQRVELMSPLPSK